MSKSNNYSKNIFTPIQLKNNIFDLIKSIKIGIKLKYVFPYFLSIFLVATIFIFLDNFFFNLSEKNYFLFLSFYLILIIITLNIIDTLNTKTALEEMKGNFNYDTKYSYKFIIKNLYSIILPNFFILIIILFFLLLIFLIIQLTKLSLIGPLIYSLSYIILFFLNLFVILSFIVLIISINYSPIIFPSFGGDSFSTIFQCYSITCSNLFFIISYTIFNCIISLTSVFFIMLIFFLNFNLINLYTNNNFATLWNNVQSIIFNSNLNKIEPFESLASDILLFIALLLIFFIISIFFSIFNIGKLITYVNLTKKYSNHNVFSNNI